MPLGHGLAGLNLILHILKSYKLIIQFIPETKIKNLNWGSSLTTDIFKLANSKNSWEREMWSERASALRPCLLEFLIESAKVSLPFHSFFFNIILLIYFCVYIIVDGMKILEVSPIVKYTALSFFADRFYPRLSR